MYGIIYKATNEINGKFYIGYTTKGIKNRRMMHYANSTCGSISYFYNAIRKYGKNNFFWDTISEANSKEELQNQERFWIKYLKANDLKIGYNMTEGGDGLLGYKHTKETKEKISRAGEGRKPSEESNKKRSKSMIGKNVGRIQSEKEKLKRANSNRGKKRTKEFCDKISKSQLGKNNSMYNKDPWNKGKKLSEEYKKQISETLRKEVNFNLIVDLYFKKELDSVNKMYQEYLKITTQEISYHCFRYRAHELGLKFSKSKKDKLKFIESHSPKEFYIEEEITNKKINRNNNGN